MHALSQCELISTTLPYYIAPSALLCRAGLHCLPVNPQPVCLMSLLVKSGSSSTLSRGGGTLCGGGMLCGALAVFKPCFNPRYNERGLYLVTPLLQGLYFLTWKVHEARLVPGPYR